MDTNMDIGKSNSLVLLGDSKKGATEVDQDTKADKDLVESSFSLNEETEIKQGTVKNKENVEDSEYVNNKIQENDEEVKDCIKPQEENELIIHDKNFIGKLSRSKSGSEVRPNGDSSELSRKNLEIEMLRALVARHEAKIFELQEKLIKKDYMKTKTKPLKSDSEASSELSTSDRSDKILEQSKNHDIRSRGRPRKSLEVNEKVIRNVNISEKRSRGRPSVKRSLNMSGGSVIKKSRGRPKKVAVSSSGSSKSSICGEGDSMDDEDSNNKAMVVESRRSISISPIKTVDLPRQTRSPNKINIVDSKRARGRPKKTIYKETGNI